MPSVRDSHSVDLGDRDQFPQTTGLGRLPSPRKSTPGLLVVIIAPPSAVHRLEFRLRFPDHRPSI